MTLKKTLWGWRDTSGVQQPTSCSPRGWGIKSQESHFKNIAIFAVHNVLMEISLGIFMKWPEGFTETHFQKSGAGLPWAVLKKSLQCLTLALLFWALPTTHKWGCTPHSGTTAQGCTGLSHTVSSSLRLFFNLLLLVSLPSSRPAPEPKGSSEYLFQTKLSLSLPHCRTYLVPQLQEPSYLRKQKH